MRNIIFPAAICAAAVLTAQSAVATPFICKLTSQSRGGFMPSQMYVDVDAAAGTAVVFDAAINAHHEDAIVVRAVEMSTRKYRLKYTVLIPSSNGEDVIVAYTVRFDEGRQKYTVQGAISGYDNNINGSGKCKPA